MNDQKEYTNEQLYHQAIIDRTVIKDELLAIERTIYILELLLDRSNDKGVNK